MLPAFSQGVGMRKLFAAAALAALISGGGPAAARAAPPGMTEGADSAVWDGKAESGPIVHRASKVSFPEESGGFKRFRVGSVTPTDVVANYRDKDGDAEFLISVFLFRPGSLPEHRLKGSLASFASLSPSAFIWAAGPLDVAADPRLHGYKGTFKTGIGPGSVLDYLYFFPLGDWTVKVRASAAGMKEPEQEGRIDAFVRALPWTAILAANGACTGTACSAPASEIVDGHMMQSLLGPLIATKMSFDSGKEASLPVAARVGKVEVRRPAEGDAVYVATIGDRPPYRLIRIPDPAKGLLTEVFGRLTLDKPLYGLLVKNGDKGAMPLLFHGEPSAEALGEQVARLAKHDLPGMFVSVAEAARRPED